VFAVCSVRPVVCRCIELFVQQTSLVCPLSEAGKLRLAADYAQLEASLSPLCHKLSDLGRPYRMIRAIRPVLPSFFHSVLFLTDGRSCFLSRFVAESIS